MITLNAEVYPWIGQSGSVLQSTGNLVARELSPRYFHKDAALAASPVYCYVASGGNDTTGVVSTNAATAAATPCATIVGAINRIVAVNGRVDGCEIRLGNDGGTPWALGATATTRTQNIGALTITRDPNIARTNARMSFGASANTRLRLGGSLTSPLTTGAVRFVDLQISRTGTFQFQGETANHLELHFENVVFDNNSHNSSWLNNSHDYYYGIEFLNMTATPLNAAGAAGATEHRLMRGVLCLTAQNVEGWLVVGCDLRSSSNLLTLTRGSRSSNKSIQAFNFLSGVNPSTRLVSPGLTEDLPDGFVFAQNVVEYISNTAATSLGVSNDDATGNTTHVIVIHNTFTGAFNAGRCNMFYDDGATARTNKLHCCKGNLFSQLNHKGDVFITDGTRLGNWAYMHGVGCEGEFSVFIDAQQGGIGGSFAQAYPGLRASIGTSSTVRNDPLFVDFEATTWNGTIYTAGLGGGNYRLSIGSPADNRVSPVLRFDLDGNTRSASLATSGAYEL